MLEEVEDEGPRPYLSRSRLSRNREEGDGTGSKVYEYPDGRARQGAAKISQNDVKCQFFLGSA
jgi:hypothetical protein